MVQSHLVAQWGTVDGHVHNRQRYIGRQYRRCCRTDAAHSKYEVHKHLLYLNDLGLSLFNTAFNNLDLMNLRVLGCLLAAAAAIGQPAYSAGFGPGPSPARSIKVWPYQPNPLNHPLSVIIYILGS